MTILFLFFVITGNAQIRTYPFYQLYQLDSIAQTPSITHHFGELYFHFLQLVEEKLETADSSTRRLVRNFEAVFAQFYIDACVAYEQRLAAPLPAWRAYFADTTLDTFQYYLLGANAHLNGGLAEAIAKSYTPGEWKEVKKKYVLFNSCLNKTYKYVYYTTINNNKRAKLLHTLTLGLAKPAGQYYLYKWRKREMRLTEYSFSDSVKYKRLYDKVTRKKEKIDKLVFTQF